MFRSKPRSIGRVITLSALVLALLPGIAWAAPPQVTGSLETVEGLRVLKLWGTAEQRGFAHGYLVGADLVQTFEGVVLNAFVVDSPADYETKVRGGLLKRLRFSPDHRAELEGMLRGITEAVGVPATNLEQLGRNLDVQDLMALNSLADWYPFACSSFSAWGELTESGQMITARNLDFGAMPGLEAQVLIAYLEPGTGRQPWVSLAWPGTIGAYTAMNAEGVTISMHDAPPARSEAAGACVPRSLVLREAIETARAATAVADVKRVLVKSPAMMGNNIHVSSPYTGQKDPAAVFEYDGDLSNHRGVTQRVSDAKPLPCWLVCTNHHCRRSPAPAPQEHPFDTARRYETLSAALGEALGSHTLIDLAWARQTMSQVAMQAHLLTLHSVFFFPNRQELHICLATPGVAAPNTDPVRLSLPGLLRR